MRGLQLCTLLRKLKIVVIFQYTKDSEIRVCSIKLKKLKPSNIRRVLKITYSPKITDFFLMKRVQIKKGSAKSSSIGLEVGFKSSQEVPCRLW